MRVTSLPLRCRSSCSIEHEPLHRAGREKVNMIDTKPASILKMMPNLNQESSAAWTAFLAYAEWLWQFNSPVSPDGTLRTEELPIRFGSWLSLDPLRTLAMSFATAMNDEGLRDLLSIVLDQSLGEHHLQFQLISPTSPSQLHSTINIDQSPAGDDDVIIAYDFRTVLHGELKFRRLIRS